MNSTKDLEEFDDWYLRTLEDEQPKTKEADMGKIYVRFGSMMGEGKSVYREMASREMLENNSSSPVSEVNIISLDESRLLTHTAIAKVNKAAANFKEGPIKA